MKVHDNKYWTQKKGHQIIELEGGISEALVNVQWVRE